MQLIYRNDTELSVFSTLVLLSDILGGIQLLVLLVLLIAAFLVSFDTIKKFRGLRRVPYKDEFQTKIYGSYKERVTRCVFLFWFLSVDVLYFLTYNLGTFLEHYVSSNIQIKIGANCTMIEGTILSESFSTNPITQSSNLLGSIHLSFNVYYLEILCILLLYLRMGLKGEIQCKKLAFLVVISTLYWIVTLIPYVLPWTVTIGYALIMISSQIFIVVSIKQTRKLLREIKFKIQDLIHANDIKIQPIKEHILLKRRYKYFLLYLITAFQILVLNALVFKVPFNFVQNIFFNSCFYKVVYGVTIPPSIVDFINPNYHIYEYTEAVMTEITTCIFFLMMVVFNVHLAAVLVRDKYINNNNNKWRYGGTASLRKRLVNPTDFNYYLKY